MTDGNEGAGSSNLFRLDHHDPHRDPEAPSLILYAEAGSATFGEAHKRMAEAASLGQIDYVLRPFVKNPKHGTNVKLSGYGVELQIKSTEYKAQDDTKLEDSEGGKMSGGGGAKKADVVKGFNFDVLKDRYAKDQPEKAEKLTERPANMNPNNS